MRRIIEEAIEKRKKKQLELEQISEELGESIGKFSFLKKKRKHQKDLFSKYSRSLIELITLQDKEWDSLSNNHYTSIFNSIQSRIDDLDAGFSNFKQVTGNFIDLEKHLKELIEKIRGNSSVSEINELKKIRKELSTIQYSDFEKRFRGNSDEIYERQKKYIHYFKDRQNVLDIGCGRGEFIRLLGENNIKSEGIDISSSMLKDARAKNLNCKEEDALQYLKTKPDCSLGGIFSAQVIEHFSPDYLKDIISEAYRVLMNDGVIVLETVNPISVFALTNIYFLDITHQKPLHPEFMRYLFRAYGLSDIEILYSESLQEHFLEEISVENDIARQFNSNVDKLNKILFSSPDYAVIGRKK